MHKALISQARINYIHEPNKLIKISAYIYFYKYTQWVCIRLKKTSFFMYISYTRVEQIIFNRLVATSSSITLASSSSSSQAPSKNKKYSTENIEFFKMAFSLQFKISRRCGIAYKNVMYLRVYGGNYTLYTEYRVRVYLKNNELSLSELPIQ